MTTFISLTTFDNEDLFVNVNHLILVIGYGKNSAIEVVDHPQAIMVKGSADNVLTQIEELEALKEQE